jgi:hypothetical protein
LHKSFHVVGGRDFDQCVVQFLHDGARCFSRGRDPGP